MSEKRFKTLTIIIEDDTGTVQTHIRSELSAPQLMDKIFELKKEIKELKEDEKLYAKEIVRLNKNIEELNKTIEEALKFKSLGGDY